MMGYHFTAARNWSGIQRRGLWPSRLRVDRHQEIIQAGVTEAVWLWPIFPTGDSLAGIILHHFTEKSTREVVALQVEYEPCDELLGGLHKGCVAWFTYHHNERYVLVGGPVPSERIRLIATYDIPDLLSGVAVALAMSM